MIKAHAKLIRQCITVHNEDNIIHHDDPTDFLVSITRAGTVHVPTTIHGEPVLANFVVLGVVSLLVIPVRSYFFAVAGCKLIQRIRVMCFETVVHMEVGWFDEPEHSSSAIGAKLSANAASVRALVGEALGQLVETAASAVAGLVIAFVASWQLTLIALVLIPLIGVNGFLLMKFMEGFIEDAKLCINTSDSSVRHSSLLGIKLFQPTM